MGSPVPPTLFQNKGAHEGLFRGYWRAHRDGMRYEVSLTSSPASMIEHQIWMYPQTVLYCAGVGVLANVYFRPTGPRV